MPAEFMDAVSHALMIIGWIENLSRDEVPPQWMWHLPDELEAHFDEVLADRKAGRSRSTNDDDIDGPVVRNELAQHRGRNIGAASA